MIECPNCGAKAQDGTLLCEACAWDLSTVEPTARTGGSGMSLDVSLAEGSAQSISFQGLAPENAEPVSGTPDSASPMSEFSAFDTAAEMSSSMDASSASGSGSVSASQDRPLTGIQGEPRPISNLAGPASSSGMRPPTGLQGTPSQLKPATGLQGTPSQLKPSTGMGPPPTAVKPATGLGAPVPTSQLKPSTGMGPPPTAVKPATGLGAPAPTSQMKPPTGLGTPASPSQMKPPTGLGATPSKLGAMAPPTSQLKQPTGLRPPTGFGMPPAPTGPSKTVARIAPEAMAKLVVVRGLKPNEEFPVYAGPNFIGRFDEQAVDIPLNEQEKPEAVKVSRQHACITWENNGLLIEDLNSTNGVFVNRQKIPAGQKTPVKSKDFIQIGGVMFQVKV